MMRESGIPDVVGLKLPAAVELLDAAGVSYTEEKSAPLGARKKTGAEKMRGGSEESGGGQSAEGGALRIPREYARVVRQRKLADGKVCLSVCAVPE